MSKLEKLKKDLREKMKRFEELRDKDVLTDEERTEKTELFKRCKELADEVQTETEERAFFDRLDMSVTDVPSGADPEARVTVEDQPIYRGSHASQLGQQLKDIRIMSSPGSSISPVQLREARSRIEQCEKRSEVRAAATGGFTIDVPSDGAFALQGETSVDLMSKGFNNSEVLKRCTNRTLNAGTQYVEIIGIDEDSRATGSRGGGVRVYNSYELDSLTASKTKFNKIRLEAHKLTGHYVASSEVMDNVTFLGQEMSQLFTEEFAFKAQDLVIRGGGNGEPLGIINADCLISQAKVVGQVADTVVTDNILNMESRIYHDSSKLVWLVNRALKPQLAKLSIDLGTSGQLVPLYEQKFNMGVTQASLNGIPCVTIEQASALGDVGDIMLCDFSQYYTVTRGNVKEDMSLHVYWLYDQRAYRFIYYFGGQPKWSSALTPYKGTPTVGPFVTLAAR